ncbi:MAG: vWA domain-containing protein, partial [Acidobacteriota bacterium]
MRRYARRRPPRRATVRHLKIFILCLWAVTAPATEPAAAGTAECGCLDLVLVIDDTGSMGKAINNIQSGLGGLITTALGVSGGDLRVGLVTFKDDVTVLSPLTGNISAVTPLVMALSAGGGGSFPEASDEALNTVIHALPPRPGQTGSLGPFRQTCAKIVVLITDATPGGFDDIHGAIDVANASDRAREAGARGIHITAIQVGSRSSVTPFMQAYATESGGRFAQVPITAAGLMDELTASIEACGQDCEPCPDCCDGPIPLPSIPAALTPDGDGVLDSWSISNMTGISAYSVEVLDAFAGGTRLFFAAEAALPGSGCLVGGSSPPWDG